MEKYLEMYDKNQEIVGSEIIIYNGKEIEVPGMSEEEVEEFIKEGNEVGNIEISLTSSDGLEKVKLIDITDGRKLFKRLDSMNLADDYNLNAFWYVWRKNRMEHRFETLSKAAQEKILAILEE